MLAAAPPAIQLTIDAHEIQKQVVHVTLTYAVRSGPLTLEYPKWIPGMHEPVGPVHNVVKLTFRGNGSDVPWQRDPFDVYRFRMTVPRGVRQLEAHFDYLPRTGETDEIAYGVAATDRLAVVNPSALLLTPQGTNIRTATVQTAVQVPEGWQQASAVDAGATVSVERRADSPLFLGQYLQKIDLPSPDGVPHTLAVVADSAEGTRLAPTTLASMRRLVTESAALFGARHYQRFTFLLALTNGLPQYGLEHHESTVNVLRPTALGDGTRVPGQWNANLLPHEFVHSWNGKYRRPYGLATTSFNAPLSTDLLWVYEGLTEYLGEVLMVRSGFYPLAAEREHLRQQILSLDARTVRTDQSLRDAAIAFPLISVRGDGRRLRFSNDVYYESALHWLEADTIIRRETGGARSLDDFCRVFFGGKNHGPEVRSYREDDLVKALAAVAPGYGWAGWLRQCFDSREPEAPRRGMQAAGWQVVFQESDDPARTLEGELDYRRSLGFQLGRDGRVSAVQPDSPALRAGIAVGMRLVRLGDEPFRASLLREQVRRTRDQEETLALEFEDASGPHSLPLRYRGGEKLPVLVRTAGTRDLLEQIFRPTAPARDTTQE